MARTRSASNVAVKDLGLGEADSPPDEHGNSPPESPSLLQ